MAIYPKPETTCASKKGERFFVFVIFLLEFFAHVRQVENAFTSPRESVTHSSLESESFESRKIFLGKRSLY
jgi:hypothetical protein